METIIIVIEDKNLLLNKYILSVNKIIIKI